MENYRKRIADEILLKKARRKRNCFDRRTKMVRKNNDCGADRWEYSLYGRT